ncbi:hypothetical protein K474DRAFT_1659478 [Panus rudis PR-1116 ss-1]|nr:hypothetical protein K474DRAFT_1659478 [Panus rudis PR-1116 ss-1]
MAVPPIPYAMSPGSNSIYAQAEAVSHKLKPRPAIHQVAQPLEQYNEAKELCRIILDCIQTHKEAWETASFVHGDISDSNILIVGENPHSVGKLITWDQCKYKKYLVLPRPVSHRQ